MKDQLQNFLNKLTVEFLTNSGYGLCLTDGDLKILWSNKIFDQWFGYVLDKYLFQVFEGKEKKADLLLVNELKKSKSSKLELKSIAIEKWFLVSSECFFDDNSQQTFYFFLFDETTEKKLIFENYILQLEILDNVEDGIYSTDFDNKIIYWNKGAEKIYGYSEKEVRGKIINSDFKLFDKIDIETQIQITQELEKYKTYYFKRKEYKKDGSEIWVEGNVTLISDTNDRPVGLIYIVRDITGKLTSEIVNNLNANLQKTLRDLTANLIEDFSFNDILFHFTKRCKELTESQISAVVKVTEHKSEVIELISEENHSAEFIDVLEKNAFSILSWLELNRTNLVSFNVNPPKIIKDLIKKFGYNHIIISPVILKNEIPYFIFVAANNYYLPKIKLEIVNSFSSLLSFIISYFDKKLMQETLEEKLKQAQKFELTSNLISGIVHDFKNLLNGIRASIDIIKKQRKQKIFEKSLHEIDNLILRGIDLSKSLLEVGKPLQQSKSNFNLKKLLNEIYSFARQISPENIKVLKNYSEDLPEIYADYSQLHQVFVNLVVNAKDAMPNGGILSISTEEKFISEKDYINNPKIKPGKYIAISIEDTGEGIPKEYLNKIFEPYFTTKGEHKGTGLGLFISQNIINKHNGLISVESTRGKGTKFIIFLPVRKPEEKRSEKMIEQVVKPNPTILLVDDEDTIRGLLSEMLSLQNFEIIEAGSAQEAISIYEKFVDKIDLVILDYFLKDSTGVDVLRFIRDKNTELPVFIATGLVDDSLVEKLEKLKVDMIIEKPYDFETLMRIINIHLKATT